jgi:hypothetical protein
MKPDKPQHTEEQKAKIKTLREHGLRWRERAGKLEDEALTRLGAEPLDKRTAIVCTAFIVSAIKDLHGGLIEAAKDIHPEAHGILKYSGPKEADGSRRYEDDPRLWIEHILIESMIPYPAGDPLLRAYCNASNSFELLSELPDLSVGQIAKHLERELRTMEETPLPD